MGTQKNKRAARLHELADTVSVAGSCDSKVVAEAFRLMAETIEAMDKEKKPAPAAKPKPGRK